MANEQNLILYLPFEEAEGSNVAYDYNGNTTRHDAAVTGGDFTSGKRGKCLFFDGESKAEIESNFVNLSGDFTIIAYVKLPRWEDGATGKQLGLFCNTSQAENGYVSLWIDIPQETWGFLVIRKSGSIVRLYLDNELKGTLTLPATLTGIAVAQDVYSTELAVGGLDEARVYNKALTNDEVAEIFNDVMELQWYIDGVNFKQYGIRVESSQGLVDLPAMKATPTIENDNYHGEMVDLSEKRYQPRQITLNCWLKANGKLDFTERVKNLYEHFNHEGTARLMCSIDPTRPLCFDVYCPDGIAQEKKWHEDMMIGTFALNVREPDPVKRVVRHQRLGQTSSTVNVAFKSDKLVTVSWGDGTVESVYGDHTGDNKLTHTYAENGIYYVLIGGVIEEITDFTTNGIVVWQRL